MVGILMGLDSRRRSVRLNDRQWAGLLLFVGIGQFAVIGLTAIFAARIVRPPFRYLSLVLGVLSLVALGLFIANADLGLGPGGMERMIVWPILVWGTAFGGYLFGSSSPAPAAASP